LFDGLAKRHVDAYSSSRAGGRPAPALEMGPGEFPVVVLNRSIDMSAALARLCRDSCFGVVHLSDEFLRDDCVFYDWPTCAFVLRNYFDPRHAGKPHVLHFGVGCKRGFEAALTDIDASSDIDFKEYDWCFMGDLDKSGRGEVLREVRAAFPESSSRSYLHVSHGFNGSDCLATDAYASRMARSVFCLCPTGNYNLDTFRLYEALEAGSIPVTLARTEAQPFRPSYWHMLFDLPDGARLPFVANEDWVDNVREMKRLLEDAREAEAVRERCMVFWNTYKLNLQQEIATFVEDRIRAMPDLCF
jgi:hypothetical protein